MPSMGSSLVAVALFLCTNRGTGKRWCKGMLLAPLQCQAMQRLQAELRFGTLESLWTETLLALFRKSPEKNSWGPSVWHLPWGTNLDDFLLDLTWRSDTKSGGLSFFHCHVPCFFCFQESYWQLLAVRLKKNLLWHSACQWKSSSTNWYILN